MSDAPHQTAGLSATPGAQVRPVRVSAVDGPGAGVEAELSAGLMIVGSGAG